MRLAITTLFLCVLTVASASYVCAGEIEQRIGRCFEQIEEGVRSGAMPKREANKLKGQLLEVKRLSSELDSVERAIEERVRGRHANNEPIYRPERERPVSIEPTAPFISGKTLRWQTNAQGGQNGTILVTSTNGLSFYLDQKNYNNTAAGITKLDGKIKDGEVYIYNRKWNETWIGTFDKGIVSGRINNTYNFTISE